MGCNEIMMGYDVSVDGLRWVILMCDSDGLTCVNVVHC
jgi:hypothetical protein